MRRLLDVMVEHRIAVREVLEAAGLRPDALDSLDSFISYEDVGRLLSACERLTRRDDFVLLAAQRTGLTDLGLPGQAALCGATTGAGLQAFADHHNLLSSASIVELATSGGFARFEYAITAIELIDTRPLHLYAAVVMHSVIRDMCGSGWRPTVITLACRAPSSVRAIQAHLQAPLRFNSDATAVVFEDHWLERPLPDPDPLTRRRIEAELRAHRADLMTDFPAAVRRVVRRELQAGHCSMERVATLLGMHRRTLDRRLQQRGQRYGELRDTVRRDIAHQLLRDTGLRVQRIAESLQFSSAANFATAFRRWTGMSPSEFRRQVAATNRSKDLGPPRS